MRELSAKDISAVKTSYGRCCLYPEFFEVFYTRFFRCSPIIIEKFKNTDLTKQHKLLKGGLNFLLLFIEGSEYARIQMQRIAEIHSRKNHNISPKLYPLWKTSLLQTITEFDKEHITPELEKQWGVCLQAGIDFLIKFY
jgi:hemoglobin-like flavoprotein